jgi:hypothetical protein
LAAYASGLGVVALEVNEEGWAALEALTTVHVPPLATWPEGREARLGAGESAPVALWVARGDERMWVEAGLPRPAATARRS